MTDIIIPITNRQAEDAVIEWQAKITKLEAAIPQARANLGQLALVGQAKKATAELRTLEDELVTAQAALNAAMEQRTEVRRNWRLLDAQRERIEADELDRKAEEHAAVFNEWEPKVAHARQQFEYLVQRSHRLRMSADRIEAAGGNA